MKNHRYFRIKEKSFQITKLANHPVSHPPSLNDSTRTRQRRGRWLVNRDVTLPRWQWQWHQQTDTL